jgi:integrase
VEAARIRYLSIEEARRFINVCSQDFRLLVQAALQTGARYGELTRLVVQDYDADSGTVSIGKSKSGKSRHVYLTEEGEEFFSQLCAGRAGSEVMLIKASGAPWSPSDQQERTMLAVAKARIVPRISFHGLRHTYASLALMGGVPLQVVAGNLGHVDTRMVEKHYGHLAPTFKRDAIRQGAPRFGIVGKTNVNAIKIKRRS